MLSSLYLRGARSEYLSFSSSLSLFENEELSPLILGKVETQK